MRDYKNLDEETRYLYHKQLISCANAFGGKNYFLQLLEAVRKTKPHPLYDKTCRFRFTLGNIKWNKSIHKDKLDLLIRLRQDRSKTDNLIPDQKDKEYKNIIHLVRALNPIIFEIRPKNTKTGDGFDVKAFDVSDTNTTKINPLFDALFFCSIETVKKLLNYSPKE